MAGYHSSAENLLRRHELVRHLRRQGIADRRVLAAMEATPREAFVPEEEQEWAYADRALAIDCEQTISQPSIVAMMSEALELTGSERVLEIGTGSGYQAAVLSRLAGEVFSIERHAGLAAQAAQALQQVGASNVNLRIGDGTLGWPEAAPFDRIIVTAAAEHVPHALWEQLQEGGLLVAPLGPESAQTLQVLRKRSGQPERKVLCGCRFVPLVSDPR